MTRGFGRLRGAASRLRYRLRPKALILAYHRVADLATDPFQLAVTPGHFAEHLEALRKHASPVSLRQLTRALGDGRVPRRAVVVTFDDGYADNLHAALPLLERHEIQATVFIASGYVGRSGEFWWDELERLVLCPVELPGLLRLRIGEETHLLELGDGSRYPEGDRQARGTWRYSEEGPHHPRHRLFCSLYKILLELAADAREGAMRQLSAWARSERTARDEYRVLSEGELVRLGGSQLIEIGGHTHNHPKLSALSGRAQREEIRGGKLQLESILGRAVVQFSYPYGSYTDQTVAEVRDAGFESACTTGAMVVSGREDPYLLPRIYPDDWDGEEFSRLLLDRLRF